MIISQILAAIQRWRLYRQTVAELSLLSDRDLNDLGISRCDINAIAAQSVDTVATQL